jgi:hypothetical protein
MRIGRRVERVQPSLTLTENHKLNVTSTGKLITTQFLTLSEDKETLELPPDDVPGGDQLSSRS